LRGAGGLHGIDTGAGGLSAENRKNGGENDNGQNEISDRPRRDDGGARANRLVDKADGFFLLGHRGRGLLVGHARRILVAEEFHIAAERDRGNFPARAVTVVKADDFGAKTDRKGQNSDAAQSGHQKMAKLMKEHDNCQNKQEGDQITSEIAAKRAQLPHNIKQTHHTLVPP
jgi:hypothetical protein